jgi:uncharacterized protein (DUF779 family)
MESQISITVDKVIATASVDAVIEMLRQRHGPVLFQ